MDSFGLIGHPVSHSHSPALFRKAFGEDVVYDLIDCGSFDEAWTRFVSGPYRAVNVTAPFKEDAALKADVRGPEVERCGAANILLKKDGVIVARNSDYLGVRALLRRLVCRFPTRPSCAVIGFGGAGKAAFAAAEDEGLAPSLYRHDGIGNGVAADIVLFTLPRRVPGCELIRCAVLVEANYLDPVFSGDAPEGGYVYISGEEWLESQFREGIEFFLGK